jgi:hypothetical protein
MNDSFVAYKSDALVITIPTSSPAAMHRLLLKGINEAAQLYVSHPDPGINTDGLLALMELQKNLLPKEPELAKAFL